MKHTIEDIAQACHTMNAIYCGALGDHSQNGWAQIPQWQKDSAIAGVTNIINGAVGTPEEGHASWMHHKIAEGWTYGEVKDPEKKTHPCMVPYIQLPTEQQAKDTIFFAVVQGMRGDL
jgi:hypothetical protein